MDRHMPIKRSTGMKYLMNGEPTLECFTTLLNPFQGKHNMDVHKDVHYVLDTQLVVPSNARLLQENDNDRLAANQSARIIVAI